MIVATPIPRFQIPNPQSTHDARGNTVTIPQPSDLTDSYSATYDAWNRLVEVKDGSNVVLKCEYDGLGRRTKKFVNTSEPLDQTYDAFQHFYYNSGPGLRSLGEAGWQLLETRLSESTSKAPGRYLAGSQRPTSRSKAGSGNRSLNRR